MPDAVIKWLCNIETIAVHPKVVEAFKFRKLQQVKENCGVCAFDLRKLQPVLLKLKVIEEIAGPFSAGPFSADPRKLKVIPEVAVDNAINLKEP